MVTVSTVLLSKKLRLMALKFQSIRQKATSRKRRGMSDLAWEPQVPLDRTQNSAPRFSRLGASTGDCLDLA
jgi:hypothetical protein